MYQEEPIMQDEVRINSKRSEISFRFQFSESNFKHQELGEEMQKYKPPYTIVTSNTALQQTQSYCS